jgi:hypothetical protein
LTLRRTGRAPFLPLALMAASLAAGCGSRYHSADCPGNPLPEAEAVLRQPGFDRLEYFRGTDHPTDRVDYETWADAQFDFSANLTYEYPGVGGQRSDCALGVTLVVRLPATPEAGKLRDRFIDFFAERLGADLADMKSAAAAHPSRAGDLFLEPVRFERGTVVGEVVGVDSYHRGRFVSVGFYERAYDRALRHAP